MGNIQQELVNAAASQASLTRRKSLLCGKTQNYKTIPNNMEKIHYKWQLKTVH